MTQNSRYVIVVGFSQGLKQVLCFPSVQELLNFSSLRGFFKYKSRLNLDHDIQFWKKSYKKAVEHQIWTLFVALLFYV